MDVENWDDDDVVLLPGRRRLRIEAAGLMVVAVLPNEVLLVEQQRRPGTLVESLFS
jgi:hypothetical protein